MTADGKIPDSRQKSDRYTQKDEFSSSEGEAVKSPTTILQHLTRALRDEELVELEINERVRTFFTYFMDHLPDPVAVEGVAAPVVADAASTPVVADAAAAAAEPKPVAYPLYVPLSYLLERNRLLITPLVPALGNAMIRTAKRIVLRFFDGVKAIETDVSFVGILEVRGEPAIQLSFPTELILLRKRRHYRAFAATDVRIGLVIQLPDGLEPIETKVVDISVGGLAFCLAKETPFPVPIGEAITMLLIHPEEPDEVLRIRGFVRNQMQAAVKDGCPRGGSRWGVQFDLTSQELGMRVEKLVALAQRKRLQKLADVRHKQERVPLPREPAPEESKGGDLRKLLGIKDKYKFF